MANQYPSRNDDFNPPFNQTGHQLPGPPPVTHTRMTDMQNNYMRHGYAGGPMPRVPPSMGYPQVHYPPSATNQPHPVLGYPQERNISCLPMTSSTPSSMTYAPSHLTSRPPIATNHPPPPTMVSNNVQNASTTPMTGPQNSAPPMAKPPIFNPSSQIHPTVNHKPYSSPVARQYSSNLDPAMNYSGSNSMPNPNMHLANGLRVPAMPVPPPGIGVPGALKSANMNQSPVLSPPSTGMLAHHNVNPPGVLPQPSIGSGSYPAAWPNPQGNMHGFMVNKFKPVDIAQERRHIMERKHQLEPLSFQDDGNNQFLTPPNQKNCSPDVFRSTLNAIPNSQTLLNKIKLPLGLLIHPFKDLSSLPVISAGTIVRCKRCRAYINPFVEFLDERRWRCNLCFVNNDVTEEFLHHPVTKTYGEPHTRPECTNSTIEFIAPQEYMVRPPQPAVYMFLFDVSHAALESGYLEIVCEKLLKNLDFLPGDKRTRIGFVTYDGTLQFYKLADNSSQPVMLVVSELDDVFLPVPDSLLVNLYEKKDLVCSLLQELPKLHCVKDNIIKGESETKSCLGSALQAAFKLMSAYGGRVTVFQQTLPNSGPGALSPREDPNARAGSASTASINPSTDFYKKNALEFSGKQIAVDFFFLNSQFIDIATVSCASRFSAGDLHYYPHLHVIHNPLQAERLRQDLDRYLTRKIGLEAVMRVRCTKGLAINTFHGNFFVRSTDLLALANVNPDAGFGLNLCIEDDITSLSSICIQAALLYTSSKGERRIRVHTMKLPIVKSAIDVFNAVDSDAVVSLLSKMAVDRSVGASLGDARDALLNAVMDAVKAYKECLGTGMAKNAILLPQCMRSYPLAISCLLKHPAFRGGVSTRLDDRVFSMIDFKMQPMTYVLQSIHPNLYRVDNLADQNSADFEGQVVSQPDQLPLSAASINRDGAYLLDTGWYFFLYVSPHTSKEFLNNVIGVKQFSNIEQPKYSLPRLENSMSDTFDIFIDWLRDQRPYHAAMQVVRSDSREHFTFMQYMRLDKTESSMSFQEFLQHVQQILSK